MADPGTIASLLTAGGTTVLAVATFGSIRSANRAARVAEQSLLAGVRPVLTPSREADATERVGFGDGFHMTVAGHRGAAQVDDGRVFLAITVRNSGAGVAVIHGWHAATYGGDGGTIHEQPEIDQFRRQQLDLYVPAGEIGVWRGAIREHDDASLATLIDTIESRGNILVDLLYGDYEGTQRTIARFGLVISDEDNEEDSRFANVVRYWIVDGDDPRAAYNP
jgi:hypothetical protein